MEQEKQGFISVIIPVYNVEQYLQECVDSVLAQTYQNFEILLVDDGSTDASGAICDQYAKQDDRIKVFHQENAGASSARNRGLRSAKGEYVYFLDSDDWIKPKAFESFVTHIERENADFIFFDAHSFTEECNKFQIEQRYIRKYKYQSNSGIKILEELYENGEYHCSIPLMFIRKRYLDTNGILFEEGIIYEDMILAYELFCKAKKVSYLNENFYQRRYRSQSVMTTQTSMKNYISARTVYEKVSIISKELGIFEHEIAKKYIVRCAFNALNIYKKLKRKEQIEYKESYYNLKEHIKGDKAYNSKALEMRCHGVLPWFCYKVFEKIFKR